MNIKEAKQEVINTVKAYLEKDSTGDYLIPAVRQRPVLLMGPPGIGKTQIMEQVARECKIALVAYTITHHTRQSAVGLPFIEKEEFGGKEYAVTEYTMSEIIASIYHKMRSTGLSEGILFIDEINCVSETLAPTMLQFLQCKTFGSQAVPKGWIIIAAGNPPEYNKSVREFDMVTLDRVRRMDIEADYHVWKEYARKEQVHSALLSYLELRPKNFYRAEADVDGLQFVTARGWEDFSDLLKAYESLQFPVTQEIVYEFLRHADVAEDVAAYLDLYRKYQDDYGIEGILQGDVSTEVYQRISRAGFDEKISVTGLLLDGLLRERAAFCWEKELTDAWYLYLKEYRSQIGQAKDAKECYLSLLKQEEEAFGQKKTAGLYTRREVQLYGSLLGFLKEACPVSGLGAEESFGKAKEGFGRQAEKLSKAEEKAGKATENAFDFMETAFAAGEEMVFFVTELTLSQEGAVFLSEYECSRYHKYNKELLVGSRRRELLSELER